MNFEEAMAQVDNGLGAERGGWGPEYDYWPNGASAWYEIWAVDGVRHRFLSTVDLGAYEPTAADKAATDWVVC